MGNGAYQKLTGVTSVILLLVLLAAFSSQHAVGDTERAGTAPHAMAKATASGLISRITRENNGTERSMDAGYLPAWEGARAGTPISLSSIDGTPDSLLLPVLDPTGSAVGIIGTDPSGEQWNWYSEISCEQYPPVPLSAATSLCNSYLSCVPGVGAIHGPSLRIAPDRGIYWEFEVDFVGMAGSVYVPAFNAEAPFATVGGWRQHTGTGTTTDDVFIDSGAGSAVQASALLDSGRSADTSEAGPGRTGSAHPASGTSTTLSPASLPNAHDIPRVPYHVQETDHWCGSAALQMVFNYYGPEISQTEISQVANATPDVGIYTMDLLRAAHFSSESTAIQNRSLRGYSSRSTGYGAASAQWGNSSLYPGRYADLKEYISRDQPVIMLTSYSSADDGGHYRVLKGYNDNLGVFTVHDPWYSAPYQGADVNFNQSFLVDDLWAKSNRWAMVAAPWQVDLDKPASAIKNSVFNVAALPTYLPSGALAGRCPVTNPTATIQMPPGFQLDGSPSTQDTPAVGSTGTTGIATWRVKALSTSSTGDISVTSTGLVSGTAQSYPSYRDRIGGTGYSAGAPPLETSREWGHNSIGASTLSNRWHLAEGSTRGGFETWILVQNPNGSDGEITLSYMTPAGAVEGPSVTIGAHSRLTFNVADHVPDEWSVSTTVSSTLPVVAERAMYWNGMYEGHNSIGLIEPQSRWYLAEGSTAGGTESWILVQNPNASDGEITLSYMTPAGAVEGPSVTIGAHSRLTFNVADHVPDEWSVSTTVSSTLPVVAERAMYGTDGSGSKTWGTSSVGTDRQSSGWYLAEGCTKNGFETWILIQNPNDYAVNASLEFMTPDGAANGPTITLSPFSRQSVEVARFVSDTWDVSTRVTGTGPIVAERAMYGDNRRWGHSSLGSTSAAVKWYMAEGCTLPGFETWILIQNPGDSVASVALTFMTSTGEASGPVLHIPARSRVSFNVASIVAGEAGVATGVNSDLPVIVERSMYGDTR